MLKSLRIRHFKSWKDTGTIAMAPITLFFGANSSGKSSIGQFLMMLKQTAESSDRRAVFFPGDDNSAVQLGSYQHMVFNRDPKNNISFQYEWTCANTMKFTDPNSQIKYSGNCMTFWAEVALSVKNQPKARVKHLKYTLQHYNNPSVMSITMDCHDTKTEEYNVEVKNYKLTRKQGRAWPLGSPLRFYGFPDEVVAYYQNADYEKNRIERSTTSNIPHG